MLQKKNSVFSWPLCAQFTQEGNPGWVDILGMPESSQSMGSVTLIELHTAYCTLRGSGTNQEQTSPTGIGIDEGIGKCLEIRSFKQMTEQTKKILAREFSSRSPTFLYLPNVTQIYQVPSLLLTLISPRPPPSFTWIMATVTWLLLFHQYPPAQSLFYRKVHVISITTTSYHIPYPHQAHDVFPLHSA